MTLACVATGTRVLGTEVFSLSGGERTTFVLSDLHVQDGGGRVVDGLDRVLARAIAVRGRVLVLGDLFDTYVTPRQIRTGIWRAVAERVRAAVDQGVEVAVLHGNRDFLLGAEWERATGSVLVRGGMRTQLAGVDTLLVHGDELCQDDLPYQRAKRWLRSPFVRGLARVLPVAVAERVARRARQRSKTVIAHGDQGRFLPTPEALDAAFAVGVEALVFGHVHRRSAGAHGRGKYFVLPAFDEGAVHLEAGAELRFTTADGAPVANPAPPLPARDRRPS